MTRTYRFAVAATLAVALTAAATTPAPAQDWVPGERLAESATRVMRGIQEVHKTTDYGYVEGICLLAAFLNNKGEIEFVRSFTKGERYAVVAGGDNGVKDLDVKILDERGNEVAADTQTDANPVVEFTVPRTGQYTIKLVMYQSGKNGGFATAGVLRKGGFEIPIRNLSTALANLVVECEQIVKKAEKNGADVLFNSGNNQWAVFGSIIRSDESLTLTGLTPGKGMRVWVTGGDTTVQDIDLYLLDSDGDVIKKDEDDDARPLIVHETRGNGTQYGLRIKNVRSRGPALILVGGLIVD
jgi:hypothetical protein